MKGNRTYYGIDNCRRYEADAREIQQRCLVCWFCDKELNTTTKLITARKLAITCDRANQLELCHTRFKQRSRSRYIATCSAIRTTAEDQSTVKYGPIATRTRTVAMII